jgi:AMP-binding enzyme C-terminal domain
MIVSGGENVYPAEIESVMTGHPAVAEVAVVGVPSAEWGESPYAVVVLRPGAQVSADELISWTRDRLAHFKCPVGVTFAPSLARTASGKLQKQAIRSALASSPAQAGLLYADPVVTGAGGVPPGMASQASRRRPALSADRRTGAERAGPVIRVPAD